MVIRKNVSSGQRAGRTGIVTVNGNGSTWSNDDVLTVGESGTGVLNILNGGFIHSDDLNHLVLIGNGDDSTGTVNVSGAGSRLEGSSMSIAQGNHSIGFLNITNGGMVSADSIGINVEIGAGNLNGFVNLMAAGILDVGLLDAFMLSFGDVFEVLVADEIVEDVTAITGDVYQLSATSTALVPLFTDGDPTGDPDVLILKATTLGDANVDGIVDVADLGILGANWIKNGLDQLTFSEAVQLSILSAAVPEPGSICLMAIEGGLTLLRRRVA